MSYELLSVSTLLGKTLSEISRPEDELIFHTNSGERYRMYHAQDCCESVVLEDICGDLDDLIGSPIVQAEENSSFDNPLSEHDESFTWTFYRLATAKGRVVLRWYGSSNGYYSESVSFVRL